MLSATSLPATGRRTRTWRRIGLAGFVVVSAALGAWRWASPPEQLVQRPQRHDIEQTVVATGRVLAPAKVNLGVLVQGIVAEVRVVEGQHVDGGEVLLTLQDDEFRALAKQAKGSLGLATARLQQVSRIDAKLAKEKLVRAEQELNQATADLSRTRTLAASGAVTSVQLSDAETVWARARETRESAAIRVAATAVSGIESQASLASVLNAQGLVDVAKVRLKYGQLTAPAPGVIVARMVEPGDVVSPAKPLLILARDGETRLLVQPDEHALSVIAIGQTANASAEAFPHRTFAALLDWIAPIVDPGRGTIDAKLLVLDPPNYLKPEMTVQVKIHGERRGGAMVVAPELVFDLESPHPYVLRVRNGLVERVGLTIGLRSSEAIEVLAGLDDSDWLVVPTTKPAKLGARVRPKAVN